MRFADPLGALVASPKVRIRPDARRRNEGYRLHRARRGRCRQLNGTTTRRYAWRTDEGNIADAGAAMRGTLA